MYIIMFRVLFIFLSEYYIIEEQFLIVLRSRADLRLGRGHGARAPQIPLLPPPDSKASWPFWRDFW